MMYPCNFRKFPTFSMCSKQSGGKCCQLKLTTGDVYTIFNVNVRNEIKIFDAGGDEGDVSGA